MNLDFGLTKTLILVWLYCLFWRMSKKTPIHIGWGFFVWIRKSVVCLKEIY